MWHAALRNNWCVTMPIPPFNEYGLLPAGIHDCTNEEVQHFFCYNDIRNQIWVGFVNFLNWIANRPEPDSILVDGSFVTDKPTPNDVDVVIDLTSKSAADQVEWAQLHAGHHNSAKVDFNVDFYPFAVGQGHDFSAFFQYLRMDEALRKGAPIDIRKGILRIVP